MHSKKEVPPVTKKEKKKLISAFQFLRSNELNARLLRKSLFTVLIHPVYSGGAQELDELKHEYGYLSYLYEFLERLE